MASRYVRACGRAAVCVALVVLALATASPAHAACSTTATAHCLQGKRFKVEIDWLDYVGAGGKAHTVAGGTADSGLFWFYGDNNWEVLVKVINGCHQNDRFWVFAAAATTLQYQITVTDTQTGAVKTYLNPLDVSSPAITDVEAFATCSGQVEPTPVPTATPAPASCPTNGALKDLRNDCSHLIYFYQRSTVVAGLTSNGSTAIACLASPGSSVVCLRGPVSTATVASLTQGNSDGGAFVPLGAGSLLGIQGNTLNILAIVGGEVFDFSGFQWFDTDSTASASAALFLPEKNNAIEGALQATDLREALQAAAEALQR